MGEQAGIPEGFTALTTGLGFIDALQPLFHCVSDNAARFGLVVEDQHCNMMGICHGGVLASLADVAAAHNINRQRGTIGGAPTINLSLDFIRAAKRGRWIEAFTDRVEVRRRFGFASGAVVCDGEDVARFNGTFYLPDHDGVVRDDSRLKLFAQEFGGD